jgi:hypothetical protein
MEKNQRIGIIWGLKNPWQSTSIPQRLTQKSIDYDHGHANQYIPIPEYSPPSSINQVQCTVQYCSLGGMFEYLDSSG